MTQSVEDIIRQKLTDAFQPAVLTVINESHKHAHHAGSPGTGESHFHVVIEAQQFEALSRLERQRAVMSVLADELAGPVHALSLQARGTA